MLKVGIVGATGYTGFELIKILLRHPAVKITSLTAKIEKSANIDDIFPCLKGQINLKCTNFAAEEVMSKTDLVFLALPHKVSLNIVPQFLKAGKKIIDLSADFRLQDEKIYEKWYGIKHTGKKFLKKAVYGLPELYRDKIKGASLIANPGCYPTSVILGIAPLIKNDLVVLDKIIVDAKSGVSGAGRNPFLDFHFPECNESVKAYKIFSHRHIPEMEQEISKLAKKEVKIVFVPHLIPINRGILSTIYLSLKNKLSTAEILEVYKKFYKNEIFIRVLEKGKYPAIRNVQFLNYCDLGLKVEEATSSVIVLSVIDNLIKGAAGQAVQNMNIMCGFDEKMGVWG